ncbi:hypothetical protein Ctha_0155 [Chloroherpeton thalassium ATCC 35110]|uniref:Uncharacterized protein TP-0789 domain-containing protein n=1 Tax=Chloroherpeton thalassium (strain ATCC 35110 / GB-78) TaxID=517418 RepID=B3QSY3_CHLT3|nr:outer membrane lipoprotein-sorting protein [Chloroherpeton thalassium]ACF12626.1 hypothetical protein Ctha_0155 [Chloroherpeton thalassium ATCC 35110]
MNLQIAAAQTAEEIIKKINDLLNQETVFSKSKMVIETSSGQLRTFEYDSWGKDHNEKTLIRYTSPARAKGQAILMRNNADDIWMYFPRTDRVRKMATHAKRQKMEGSDFSYEDMGSGDSFLTDFDVKLLGSGKIADEDCFKLELIRKSGSTSAYQKMSIWSAKKHFHPLQMEYFEDDGIQPAKRLTLSDIETIQGVPTAMKMIMKDLADGTQTEMQLLEVKYGVSLDEKMFTERGLRQ